MLTLNKWIARFVPVLAAAALVTGCQKMDKPELGSYPKDTNPPGGPLKFYAAFNGSEVDSIRANFGSQTKGSYVAGVSGQAFQGAADAFISYPSANDFKQSSSFSIAFWMKSPAPAAGIGAQFLFAQATTTDIWTKADIFLLMEDGGQSNTTDGAALKFYLLDQWLEFVGDYRIKNILNDQWHHLAFVYNSSTSKLTTYVDGAALTGLPANKTDVVKSGAPRGAVDLSKSSSLVIGGPAHLATGATPDGWMVNYRGAIDQFRLYGTALTGAEVAGLFNGKQ